MSVAVTRKCSFSAGDHPRRRKRQSPLQVFLVAALGWWSLSASTALRTQGLPLRTPRRAGTKPSKVSRRNAESKPAGSVEGCRSGALSAAPPTSWKPPAGNSRSIPRRTILASAVILTWTSWIAPSQQRPQQFIAWADDGASSATTSAPIAPPPDFPGRNRNGNRDALIREDYWYMLGKTPPRLLTGPISGANDPQFNAFGSCRSDDPGSMSGPNPCTYVSLNLRIPAYNRYASSISYGTNQYKRLGSVLRRLQQATDESDQDRLRLEALGLLQPTSTTVAGSTSSSVFPSPIVDAELKLVLFATAMTTSPNFPQASRELLIARYYANEVHYANRQLLEVLQSGSDPTSAKQLALDLWEYGRDSWNSFFQIVNQHITPKVGDRFELVA